MVSKNQIKLITSLHQKKYRQKTGLFIAEGVKVINEFTNAGYKLYALFATNAAFFSNVSGEVVKVSDDELKKISRLSSPNAGLAIFYMPEEKPVTSDGLILALDAVNDPGNLGTIIRLCDWFGIKQLVCSVNTVDCYNPKVVQATMGSLTRLGITYTDLVSYLENSELPVFGALMHGDNLYSTTLPKAAVLVMGNEANGISQEVMKTITNSITIPRFGDIQQTESLNVATATAIILSEFCRRG